MASDTTRAICPTTRTILWSPRRADVSRAPQARARFCSTQRALARLEHDVAAPGHPGLGFLLGSHHHCPRLDVDYGVADMIVSWPRSIDRTELALPTTESRGGGAAPPGGPRPPRGGPPHASTRDQPSGRPIVWSRR